MLPKFVRCDSMLGPKEQPVVSHRVSRSCSGVLLFATCSMLAFGCAAQPAESIAFSLAANFELRAGQSAVFAEENLAIRFESISADSRCARGEVCVWEGDATISVSMQLAGGAQEVHELHTNARFPNSAMFQGFSVRLVALFPQPLSGQPLETADYVAVLQVTRGLSGKENIL